MSRSLSLLFPLVVVPLLGCRRDPPPEPSPAVAAASSGLSGTETTHPGTFDNLPDVRHRGWWILQIPHGESETQVQVWAPGDHLKEAFSFWVPDLYREHNHFAEWSHGSLFAIRRIGDYRTEDWTDELWEYRDGHEPRRIATGQGVDFRVSPDGRRILLVVTDSAADAPYRAQILDRTGKVLATRSTADYGREVFVPLDMGDSVAYLGADIDEDPYRWSLAADSLEPVELPEEAINDRLFLADRDLLVASDYPVMGDADEVEAFRKARTPVVLRAFHLRDGRRTELARAVAREFHPVPGENDSIEVDTDTPDSTMTLPPPWR